MCHGPIFCVWLLDDTRLDEVHALLRAAAYVYELPADRLAAEARQAIAAGKALRRDAKTNTLLEVLPDVDVAEVDWSRAGESDIDVGVVESLIHHPSEWVQRLAAAFIDQRLRAAERRSVCERLLASGTGNALFWAAALTAGLPDGHELLIHRLGGRDTAGAAPSVRPPEGARPTNNAILSDDPRGRIFQARRQDGYICGALVPGYCFECRHVARGFAPISEQLLA